MDRKATTLALIVALTMGLAQRSDGQSLWIRPSAVTGLEARGYSFRPGLGIRTVSQWSVPVVVVMPLGDRLSADISSRWAYSRVTTDAGAVEDLSGLTDTDVRVAYTLGRQAAVVSLVASLPTGRSTVSSTNFVVIGALGSDFLTLPVATYGTGAKITGGVAAARNLGGINLGVGASLRWASEYAPFSDVDLSYEPGVETRLQLGADGIVGSGRLSAGLTFSTFGDDNFIGAGGGGITQTFLPGSRVLGELTYVAPLGNGNLTLYAWNFHRTAARVEALTVPRSKENIFDIGASWRLPAGRRVVVIPQSELKQWHRDGSSAGRMGSFLVGLEIAAAAGFTIEPSARTDFGFVSAVADRHVPVQGWGLSTLGRIAF